ncbi:hypothetical protein L873DRAFT_1804495 [Choiromyces venosus 120613-1]|uniref:Uncharacterized protein n=1 Tax=Choiromyces venosus 120613-1 TaxID=1336337 RepID=A0A3N4JRF1_9PEZI|nr:hypothetical protein L873DRAFT_1804495 [Choiromyces venosus 120613-1]
MFSRAARQSLVRAQVARRSGQVVRPARRLNSTTAGNANQNAQTSPLVAGMAGGAVTLLGGYAWYHFSGTKQVVQSARKTAESVESIKNTIASNTPPPSNALSFIRSVSKQYVTMIPGAGSCIDSFFDEFDDISSTHSEEVSRIVSDTYGELRDTVWSDEMNEEVGRRVTEILKRRGQELKELSKDAGQQILEKNPQLKEKVQGSMSQLKKLGKQYGPEAQRIVDEAYKQAEDIVNQGLNLPNIGRISNMINEKTEQVKELGKKLGDKAWEEGSQEMDKYLDKMPQVKQILDENKDELKALAVSGGISGSMSNSSSLKEIFDQVKRIGSEGESKDSIEKFKKLVEEKVKSGNSTTFSSFSGGDDGWQYTFSVLEKYIKTIPGGEKALQETPDLREIIDIGKKGPEAEKIAKGTFEELTDVLGRRLKQAKKLASGK